MRYVLLHSFSDQIIAPSFLIYRALQELAGYFHGESQRPHIFKLFKKGVCAIMLCDWAEMKIDLHVHTKERSACGQASEEDQIRAAIEAGLDAIVFTDHHLLVPREQLKALNDRYAPFRVFGGIEITVDGEDFLVLGFHHRSLEKASWTYPELHAFVRKHTGFLALAHPFRYHPDIKIELDRYLPDALEIHSANTPLDAESRINELAECLGIPLLCNSDAHSTAAIGTHYNILDGSPSNDRELVALLRSGCVMCHTHRTS